MIRVLVVDDHDIVRDALASLLGDVSDFQVVGVASSIRDALPLLDSTRRTSCWRIFPLAMAAPSNWCAHAARPDEGEGYRHHGLLGRVRSGGGADGGRDRLRAEIAADVGAARGDPQRRRGAEVRRPCARAPARAGSIGGESTSSNGAVGLERLSPREVEVFRLVVAGSSSKDVARRLCISVKTVETHRTNMNRKLAVRTTADLVRFAAAHGIAVAPRADASVVPELGAIGDRSLGRRDGLA